MTLKPISERHDPVLFRMEPPSGLPAELQGKCLTLWQIVRRYAQPIVAFSGGVDSSLVAAVLARTHDRRVLLVTADSPSLSQRQRETADRVARELNLPHRWLQTQEAADPLYQRNHRDRCYYCKSHLYAALRAVAAEYPAATILSGTNHDDLSDYRPGLQAAAEQQVQSPLAEAGFTKDDVRGLARALHLSVHDLPAAPCLASRVAYGVEVTPARLHRVEQAESILWQAGFSNVRVRVLPGEIARIEVPKSEVDRLMDLCEQDVLGTTRRQFRELGFADLKIATEGFVSGSLNLEIHSTDVSPLPKLPIL
ncbi:MAG: ATP-dependent sacrificial sulfur transferase LarE [Planctomycetaceae bacterium]|nr:ATP-dependent sacrificial sulfur transferase LarE [Planctomycetaceae bacterium]